MDHLSVTDLSYFKATDRLVARWNGGMCLSQLLFRNLAKGTKAQKTSIDNEPAQSYNLTYRHIEMPALHTKTQRRYRDGPPAQAT